MFFRYAGVIAMMMMSSVVWVSCKGGIFSKPISPAPVHDISLNEKFDLFHVNLVPNKNEPVRLGFGGAGESVAFPAPLFQLLGFGLSFQFPFVDAVYTDVSVVENMWLYEIQSLPVQKPQHWKELMFYAFLEYGVLVSITSDGKAYVAISKQEMDSKQPTSFEFKMIEQNRPFKQFQVYPARKNAASAAL